MISKRIKELVPYKTETTKANIRLSSNEMPIVFPDYVKRRICEEIAQLPINRYPDPKADELKEVLAYRFGVKEENLVLGNGSDELIYYLSIAIGELNRGIYYPVPTYSMYQISAKMLGRESVEVKVDDKMDIDLESSLRTIEEKKPVLSFFSYPNNPTGNCFSTDRIARVRDTGLFTVLDEAYYHFSKKTFLEDAISREDTVVLRTLSKIGMAGIRVGILIAKDSVAYEINKMRLPFNITYPSQVIAKLMLTEFYPIIEEAINMVVRERERLFHELSRLDGIKPYPSEANFILFESLLPPKTLHRELIKRNILIRDVSYMPRLESCLRVNVGFPEENDAFLEALSHIMKTQL